MTKIRDQQLRQAFTRWDRSTAYACAMRKQPYDHQQQLVLRAAWDAEMSRGCAS